MLDFITTAFAGGKNELPAVEGIGVRILIGVLTTAVAGVGFVLNSSIAVAPEATTDEESTEEA